MSQAAYIQDMMANPTPDLAAGPSEIISFYTGCNVLLTGGSGFLGKLFIEKILRSCPEINTLFLFLRAKNEKSPEERFNQLFNDVIFDRLKRERPHYARKVVLIEGDIGHVGLGLSSEHRELLRSTHIVVHGAATVRFDEKLRIAASVNVRGTKELLSLAKKMINLKAFVYVSTAYSNCVQEVIEEKFYPPPIAPGELLDLVKILNDVSLDHLTPVLMGQWPNTYAFTKAVAEEVIRSNSRGLPLCVVRPSIVIPTAKEPVSGWINNVCGATGVLLGVGFGLIRCLRCDPDMVADLIPADYVINNIIVAAWDTAKAQSINMNNANSPMVPDIEEPVIYNVVSSCQKPITWEQVKKYNKKYGIQIPSIKCLWYFSFRFIKYRWLYNVCVVFLHLIPAVIADSLAWLTGRNPMLLKAYRRIHKLSPIIEYFTLRQWRFQNNNVLRVMKNLSFADRNKFDLDIKSLNWEHYTYHEVRGLRVYIAKDPLDTLPQARVRYNKLKLAHYTLVTALCGILFWLILTFLRFIGIR